MAEDGPCQNLKTGVDCTFKPRSCDAIFFPESGVIVLRRIGSQSNKANYKMAEQFASGLSMNPRTVDKYSQCTTSR